MGKWVCVVLMLSGMSVVWVACSIEHTVAPLNPAAKRTAGDSSEQHYIHWTCGASEWSMPADSVWTIFYGSNRFYTDGKRVHISEYLTPNPSASIGPLRRPVNDTSAPALAWCCPITPAPCGAT